MKFSRTPSSISLTEEARSRPIIAVRRASSNQASCSRPPARSHQSDSAVRRVSSPRSASARYAGRCSAVTHASVIAVIPKPWRNACAARMASSHRAGVKGGMSRRTRFAAPSWSVPCGDPSASRSIRPSARVGRRGGDAGQLQGPRAHPGPVAVAVLEEDGAAGDGGVQVCAGRSAAGEGRHPPAATDDPRLVGVGRRIGADPVEIRLAVPREVVQIARQDGPSPDRRVHVSVLEAGQQRPALEVDDTRGRTGERSEVAVRPTAAIRPARTASALAAGCAGLMVHTAPLTKSRSAGPPRAESRRRSSCRLSGRPAAPASRRRARAIRWARRRQPTDLGRRQQAGLPGGQVEAQGADADPHEAKRRVRRRPRASAGPAASSRGRGPPGTTPAPGPAAGPPGPRGAPSPFASPGAGRRGGRSPPPAGSRRPAPPAARRRAGPRPRPRTPAPRRGAGGGRVPSRRRRS